MQVEKKLPELPITDRHTKLSEHFTLHELIRSETAERKAIDNLPSVEIIPKLEGLCHNILEPIRQHFGVPFQPSSGYRCIELNTLIGGSKKSQHCLGEAVDLEVPGVSNYELAKWVRDNLAFDQVILEFYQTGNPTSGWVHISLKHDENENRNIALTYTNHNYVSGLIT